MLSCSSSSSSYCMEQASSASSASSHSTPCSCSSSPLSVSTSSQPFSTSANSSSWLGHTYRARCSCSTSHSPLEVSLTELQGELFSWTGAGMPFVACTSPVGNSPSWEIQRFLSSVSSSSSVRVCSKSLQNHNQIVLTQSWKKKYIFVMFYIHWTVPDFL